MVFTSVDETEYQKLHGTYTFTDPGVLTLLGEDIARGQTVRYNP